jgi:ABC-type antimicrobial peptide transport system permease subunit
MGTGVLVSTSDFPTSLLNVQENSIPGPNAVLVRIRSGVSESAAYRSLEEIDAKINAVPNDTGSAGGVISALRPAEIVNFRSMGTTPAVLAAALAAGAVVALGLTLAASVRRRRRDLALLKTLGFTQRQLAASIACQATVASLAGIIVGIPLGIALGRQLWTVFAHNLNAVPDPAVPVLAVFLVGLGALVFANLVAVLPGLDAARTPTALVLGAE